MQYVHARVSILDDIVKARLLCPAVLAGHENPLKTLEPPVMQQLFQKTAVKIHV